MAVVSWFAIVVSGLLALATPLLGGRQVRFPLPQHDRAMIRFFGGLMEVGQFGPGVDCSYPLERIVDVFRYVETGRKVGNVVITIEPSAPSGRHAAAESLGR